MTYEKNSKVFTGVICFLAGAGAVLLSERIPALSHSWVTSAGATQGKLQLKQPLVPPSRQSASIASNEDQENDPFHDPFFDQFMNDDFFKGQGTFGGGFGPNPGARGLFSALRAKHFGKGMAAEVSQREDKDFVYFDISLKGIDPKDLKFKVQDDQVNISAKVENKTDENGNTSFYTSRFERSFPVPPEVDAKRVQVEQGKDVLTLKFPKA